MSSPDIRVRLSPEGVQEVVNALRRVSRETQQTARAGAGGINLVNDAVTRLKRLLPTLGLGLSAAGFAAMARNALDTAEAVGQMAQTFGSTAEEVSVLRAAFIGANLSAEQMQSALAFLTNQLGELRKGTQQQVDEFRKLGLSVRDFEGLNAVQAFTLIAQRMALLSDSTEKTDVAMAIFGRNVGSQLIPILNELGTQGFDAARAAAESLGVVIDSETARAAKAASDSMTAIRQQAQGLATQFIIGLAPSIVEAMSTVRDETAGKGVSAMRRFGEETGRILRTVIATFRLFAVGARDLITGLGRQVGGLAAVFGALSRGEFREAGRIWKQMGEDGDRDFAVFAQNFKENLRRLTEEASRDARPIEVPVQPTIDEAAAREAAERLARVNAEIAGRKEAERLRREAEKAAQERARREKEATEALFELEQQLLQARGRNREAEIRALDQQIAKYRETFQAANRLTDELEQRLARFREASIARIDFQEAIDQANRHLEDLRIQRERIEQDVELGITSQLTGQERILEIERERLGVLRELAAAARAAAEASGDPALIAQAEALSVQIREIEVSVSRAANAWAQMRDKARDAITGDLASFLSDGIREVNNLREAFEALGDSILRSLQRIAAEAIAQDIARRVFGMGAGGAAGGGWLDAIGSFLGRIFAGGFARGGRIRGYAGGGTVDATPGGLLDGPGTSTSDSILARVSRDEFVVRAAAVRRPGVLPLLERINNFGLSTAEIRAALSARMAPVPRFATGGLVGGAPQPAAGFPGAPQVNITQVIQAPTQEIGRRTAQQAAAAAARAVADAARRNN